MPTNSPTVEDAAKFQATQAISPRIVDTGYVSPPADQGVSLFVVPAGYAATQQETVG